MLDSRQSPAHVFMCMHVQGVELLHARSRTPMLLHAGYCTHTLPNYGGGT